MRWQKKCEGCPFKIAFVMGHEKIIWSNFVPYYSVHIISVAMERIWESLKVFVALILSTHEILTRNHLRRISSKDVCINGWNLRPENAVSLLIADLEMKWFYEQNFNCVCKASTGIIIRLCYYWKTGKLPDTRINLSHESVIKMLISSHLPWNAELFAGVFRKWYGIQRENMRIFLRE